MNFDEFCDTQLEPITRYARLLTGDRQDAHDLVADVMIAASKRWDVIRSTDQPVAYVRRMVTNRHIDMTRRRRRFLWSQLQPVHEQIAELNDATSGVDQRQFLEVLLRELPARQRAALVCRFYLGLDDAQIADELKIGESAVRSSISRGLSTIRSRTTAQDVGTHLT